MQAVKILFLTSFKEIWSEHYFILKYVDCPRRIKQEFIKITSCVWERKRDRECGGAGE